MKTDRRYSLERTQSNSTNEVPRLCTKRIAVVAAIAAATLAFTGCGSLIRRAQSPDAQRLKSDETRKSTKYIRDFAAFSGLNFAKVEGIGLVSGLDGTGSDPKPGGQRDFLLAELRKGELGERATEVVASKNTSMVIISGYLPPGIKKGQRFDVQVSATAPTLPTETTSLLRGRLERTSMRPMALMGRKVQKGHVQASAEGPVLINSLFETRDDVSNHLRGIVLGGGVATADRPLGLVVTDKESSIKMVRSMAHSINQRFTTTGEMGREGVAEPKTDRTIKLEVPPEYEHNSGRFFRALLSIAFDETTAARVNRLASLDRQIAVPETAKSAALELEAIGQEGIPSLKRALRHHDFGVKFAAAEALAYMGESDGVQTLETAAENEPAFRWHALAALTSLDSIDAREALVRLLHVNSIETRYGAFRALQSRSPEDIAIEGKWLADDYNFHVIPSTAPPVLHFSKSERPEIVVFGESQAVSDGFLFVEPGLTVKGVGKGNVEIVRYSVGTGAIRKTCGATIAELIPAAANVGMDYSTLLAMFRDAKRNNSLDSRLAVDAVPRVGTKSKDDLVGGPPNDEAGDEIPDALMTVEQTEDVEDPLSVAETGPGTIESDSGSLEGPESEPSASNSRPRFLGRLRDWVERR
jgi:flagellar basal body P-ring protein FlgI